MLSNTMTILLSKHFIRVALFLASTQTFLSLRCQHNGSAVLFSKGRADAAHVDAKQLPRGAVFELDEERLFVLHGPGVADLQVIPLGLTVHPPGRDHSECGVYFYTQGVTDGYVPLLGQQPSDNMCDEIKAVGLTREPGPRPSLIAIADAYNVHGTYHSQPFVLRWNPSANIYEVDRGLSAALARQKGSSSIAGVRALLAQQH